MRPGNVDNFSDTKALGGKAPQQTYPNWEVGISNIYSLVLCAAPMPPEKGESMRSRTNQIIIRLSDEELADLNEKVSRASGSRERFIRQCISGAVIREAPSVDVPKLIYEVRRVGANLNRILIIANARGLLEVPELRRAMERNRELEVRIVDAYTKD